MAAVIVPYLILPWKEYERFHWMLSLSIFNLVLPFVQMNGFSDPTDSQKGEEPPLQWPGARSQGGVVFTASYLADCSPPRLSDPLVWREKVCPGCWQLASAFFLHLDNELTAYLLDFKEATI